MDRPFYILADKLRWLVLALPILIAALLVISLLLSTTATSASVPASNILDDTLIAYDSPNVITAGMTTVAGDLKKTMGSTKQAVSNGRRSIATSAAWSGRLVARSFHTSCAYTANGLRSSATFMVRAVSKSVAFIIFVPGSITGFFADTTVVSAAIRPADTTPVPIIDPSLHSTVSDHSVLPTLGADITTTSQADSAAMWPIHGKITTLFGVPHWPYQPTHTGLDISDGQRSGTTEIKPFKPGRVIHIEHSNRGLGNHVIIDHGEGVTSVYGHLSSIKARIGQAVDKDTTLGFEGSTGASTGTHLHLEIRINGQPTDPLRFINGRP